MPVKGLRRHRAAAGVDVLRRRDAAELGAEIAQKADQLLARGEPARDEAGRALRFVPAPEVLDHRLWMDGRLGVAGELPHRRRALQPPGAGSQLVEDLLVRVALADPGLERG